MKSRCSTVYIFVVVLVKESQNYLNKINVFLQFSNSRRDQETLADISSKNKDGLGLDTEQHEDCKVDTNMDKENSRFQLKYK